MSKDQFDIIIIGAGTAGMACAIKAAERGLRIGVIEKNDRPGGTLYWTGGHMSGGGTRLQARKGISDSPEDHLADILRINEHSGDPGLIRKAVQAAPDTLNWLDDLGFEWATECPRIIYGHVPYTKERTHYGKDKGLSILKVFLPLWNKGVEDGHIHPFYNYQAKTLHKNDNRYNQLTADGPSGHQDFFADHIVLTTGGYGSNPELFHSLHPQYNLISSTYPSSTGDGLLMTQQLGCPTRFSEHHVPSLAGLEMEPGSGRCDFNQAWAMVLTSVYRPPREIYVNQQGQRFMDEGETNADTRERLVVQHTDGRFWLIFDETALQSRNEDGSENPIIIGWDTTKIKEEAQKEKAIWQADSIAELALKTGLPVSQLEKTIQQFNNYQATGADPDYGRQPLDHPIKATPYYAILAHASVLVTFAGPKVNENLELVHQNGEVLTGLYAAGEILGLGATSGKAFCSGMAITPALSFGKILGETLG